MNIFCLQQANQKSLAITLKDLAPTNIKKMQDYCIGYHNDEIIFINIFSQSFCENYQPGLIYPTDDFIKQLKKLIPNLELPKFALPRLVIAKIVEITPVPNTHLNYCDVLVGKNEILKIVCGAANAKKDLITVAALDNTLIPTGVLIKKGKLMNLESNGMLCSNKELGIESEQKGIIELSIPEERIGSIFSLSYTNLTKEE